ncbi:MAG: hypothetical protein HYZ44_01600 [Bacteroidetes bacterium]|nr:hypothetical protein [Bacteroidota bacterium]
MKKRTNYTWYILICFVLIEMQVCAQASEETIKRTATFEKKSHQNALLIFNVNGSVKVEGYAGDQIIIEVQKKITGKSEARVAKGKSEIDLVLIDKADTLILYVKGIGERFGKENKKNGMQMAGWGYNWQGHDDDKEYDYNMNFVVKVPYAINLHISTINQGNITVHHTKGTLEARNINGGIHLTDIAGTTTATTINGEVDLEYSTNPPGDSKYYSLNGNINAQFKSGLNAQLTFKSFQGDLFSSIDDITPLAVSMEKTKRGEGI